MLESQHPVESPRPPRTSREHHPALRQVKGRLVDQRGTLQPRAHPPRRHRRQDRLQEEPRPPNAPLAQRRTGAPVQLQEGRPLRLVRRGRGHLHHSRALAGEPPLQPHPIPSA